MVKAKTWKWCCKLCAVHTRNISLSIRDVIYWKIFVYKDILKIAWIWNGQKRIHVCVKLSILSPWSVLDTGKCFPLVLWDKWATNRSNDSVTFQFLHRTFSWLISFKDSEYSSKRFLLKEALNNLSHKETETIKEMFILKQNYFTTYIPLCLCGQQCYDFFSAMTK